MRRVAREQAGKENFIEVYVSTDFETCMKRDPKGLYKKDIKNFTGKDSVYEKPENPEIILDTIQNSAEECAEIVYREILKYLK
jgi:adenylylsulfate kinase-like enzyme